ncbi:MAG: hypothetical protein NC093_03920 [Alistipes sp.]|nr:hypothetical protein [Alistipes sp.]
MKRIDVLKEFLITIFGSTTVKPASDKIYRSGNLFSSCKFNNSDHNNYLKLLYIAFLADKPKIQRPNYEPIDFQREESISRFITYLISYKEDITFPTADDKAINTFAYNAAITILSAIFTKSTYSDKMVIENEDISTEFRKALDDIKVNYISRNINKIFDSLSSDNSYYIYDTDYNNDKSKYNDCLLVSAMENNQYASLEINEILLKIYVDENGNYDKRSRSFFNNITSHFHAFNKQIKIEKDLNSSEFYLSKPLSLIRINNDIPLIFYFVTYLDEESILHRYKCKNEKELNRIITDKALMQYEDNIAPLISEYEISLVSYTEDLIKRVLNLDLIWLYSGDLRKSEKCREEVEKVIVGYPEIYTYIDSCPENIIIQQLLAILHHAVVEITDFIHYHGDYIAECARKHQCSDHVKYIKGKINSKKFKELRELSENSFSRDSEEPKCLGEMYYYTSSNELDRLLDVLQEYYNSLKKSRKFF